MAPKLTLKRRKRMEDGNRDDSRPESSRTAARRPPPPEFRPPPTVVRRVPVPSVDRRAGSRPEFTDPDFREQSHKDRYETDLISRSIICPKNIKFESFQSMEIKEVFDSIGLAGLCELSGPCSDRLVRLFYCNLKMTGMALRAKSYMFGREVVFNAQVINRLIGYDFDDEEVGEDYYQQAKACPFIKAGEGPAFLELIMKNTQDIQGFRKPTAKDLNMKARVIQNIISHVVLPRDGHRNLVSYMDLYIMHKLYHGRRFNPGAMIIRHMADIGSSVMSNLAYGVLIWKLIEDIHGPIPATEPKRVPKHTDVFDVQHLRRMGVVEVNGIWNFVSEHAASASTSRAPDVDIVVEDVSMEDSPPASQPPPPPPRELEVIQKLDLILSTQIDARREVQELRARVEALQREVQELRAERSMAPDDIPAPPPPPPPPPPPA